MECKKCGYENIDGVSKCGKCGVVLGGQTKSCPKCATKNKIENKKCKKCGYIFKENNVKIFIRNLIISIFLVIVLFIIVLLWKDKAHKFIHIGFQVIAIFIILLVLLNSLLFSKKNEQKLKIPEMLITNKEIEKMKVTSRVFLVILVLILLGLVSYIFIKYFIIM